MKIARTQARPPVARRVKPSKEKENRSHHIHHRPLETGGIPHVRESYIELPSSALGAFGHHLPAPLATGTAGVVGALAAARGYQNLKSGGTMHTIEGMGHLALAAASGLRVYEAMQTDGAGVVAHGDHGFGTAALEMVHGGAELAVGSIELYRGTEKPSLSLLRLVKGSAIVAAQVVPSIAPAAHLVHLGTVVASTVMNPHH